MPSVVNTKSSHTEMPPRTRAVFRSLAILFLVIMTFGQATPVKAADHRGEEPIQRFSLLADLSGQVDLAGGLVFLSAGSRIPLLRTELVSPTDSRRRRITDIFHAEVTDGVTCGHRGFSSRADDDQDTEIDEDPLDGIDNDQDGYTDEDYAAISDAMVAIHLSEPGNELGGLHLEYYHWTTPHLSSVVFINTGEGREFASRGSYRIHSSGPEWLETRINSLRHTVTGRPEKDDAVAFVCQTSRDGSSFSRDPCSPGSNLWLGVMVLDRDSSTRFKLDSNELALALGDTPVPLAICAADSWMQLNRILGDARRVYEGMTDPVDNRQVHWIVPPACTACKTAGPPAFDLKTDSATGMTLTADVAPGQWGLLDPDLFRVGDRLLGAPREIRWLPDDGEESVANWKCMTAGHLRDGTRDAGALFLSFPDLQGHQAKGRLEFIFDNFIENPDPATATELVGRYLDGRPLRSSLRPELPKEPTSRSTEDPGSTLKSSRHQLSLSSDLLIGWPNPFSDMISIRFKVPRTMKEAFVWDKDEEQPLDIDLEGNIQWSGGFPNVSVKIYSINGQELVTLYSANQGVGEDTVQWSGTDAFGRKVASGTYFCKLQMDDWSVTRRLVFIR
ncbi:MAG: T9SS type A sorting domain-containing protein [Candidatus Krumholzibacteria bacterium]|nr:T9SS type A sorting domain-containing protein [Candidatus Krumholzibacteria bacterium]